MNIVSSPECYNTKKTNDYAFLLYTNCSHIKLHIVNKVLSKKGKETSEHISTLEEGFQRLQETFRTTVLDSLDADAQLNDEIKSLKAVVDSLTVPQSDDVDFDPLGRPAAKINLFPCGLQTMGSKVDETVKTIILSGHTFLGPLKNPDNTLCLRVGRKAKYSRKRKEAFGMMKRAIRGYPVIKTRMKKDCGGVVTVHES